MKILAISPIPTDGTAWWRSVSPLTLLRETSGVDVTFAELADHVAVAEHDILCLQRPFRPHDLAAIGYAKMLGKPVVLDYDDDYTDIPTHNSMRGVYMQPDVQTTIRQLIGQADLVTVSTVDLKRKFRPLARKIAVVPNAFDDRMVLHRGGPRLPYRRVLWRGSASHNEDLAYYGDAIVKAAQESRPAVWAFVGMSVYQLHARMPKGSIEEHGWSDVLNWFRLLGELRPAIMHVPLVDTPFNRQKSNIALLESVWAGAALLAPAWDNWSAPGVTTYATRGEYCEKLKALCAMPAEALREKAEETWLAVRERMLLSRANKLRLALFAALAKDAHAKRIQPINAKDDKLDELLAEVGT